MDERVLLTKPRQFGKWLKRERKRRRLTEIQLAALSGVHPVTIERIEIGSNDPSFATMLALLNAVGRQVELVVSEAA